MNNPFSNVFHETDKRLSVTEDETIKRLGLATYDDLRYLLELLNVTISLSDDTEERDALLRCYAWVSSQSTGRMFSALMEGVDYTTMEGGE